MTDAINTLLKSSFYDFMHYMATILTKHGALGLLLSNKAFQFLRLIQLQIEHYPLPKSSAQMKIESTVTDSALRSTSNFPFFNIVYDAIEDFLKVNHISSVTDISQNHLDCLSEKLKRTYEDKQVMIMISGKFLVVWNVCIIFVFHFLFFFHFLLQFYKNNNTKFDENFGNSQSCDKFHYQLAMCGKYQPTCVCT